MAPENGEKLPSPPFACGHDNPEENRFCDSCGIPRGPRCPQCGVINRQSAKFCGQCGLAFATRTIDGGSAAIDAVKAYLRRERSTENPVVGYDMKCPHLATASCEATVTWHVKADGKVYSVHLDGRVDEASPAV